MYVNDLILMAENEESQYSNIVNWYFFWYGTEVKGLTVNTRKMNQHHPVTAMCAEQW